MGCDDDGRCVGNAGGRERRGGHFGDFGGTLWALDAATGEVIWSHKVSDYTGVANDIARTSPSVAGNTLVVGSLTRPVMLGIEGNDRPPPLENAGAPGHAGRRARYHDRITGPGRRHD